MTGQHPPTILRSVTEPLTADPAVLVPPGLPLMDAAAWVGNACWTELRLHAILTDWLAVETDAESVQALWSERADAAERAEAWHRRLPELRELPRAEFVRPASPAVSQLFEDLELLRDPAGSAARRGALAAVLRGLRLGYHKHQKVVVGPADGPTATSLTAALRSTFDVGGADPDPTWVDAVAAAGGLP